MYWQRCYLLLILAFPLNCSNDGGRPSFLASGQDAAAPLKTACLLNAAWKKLDDDLYVCDVDDVVTSSFTKSCLQKIDIAYRAVDEGCQNKLRGRVQDVLAKLMTWELAGIKGEDNAHFDSQKMTSFFENFGYWYRNVAPFLHRDFYSRSALGSKLIDEMTMADALSRVSAALWKKINSNDVEKNFDQPFKSSTFSLVQSVIDAALRPGMDGIAAPPEFVLQLLVDALMPLNERLTVLIDLHDLACELGSCGSSNSAAIRQVVALNASLDDPATYSAALSEASLIPASLLAVYKTIEKSHALLLAPLMQPEPVANEKRLGGLGADYHAKIATMDPIIVPPHLRGFVNYLRKFKDLSNNVHKTGFFSGYDSGVLEVGLDNDALLAVKNRNQVVTNQLQQKLDAYQSKRQELLTTMRQTVEADLNGAATSYSLRSVSLRLQNLVNDLNGVRASIAANKDSFSRYVAQLDRAENGKLFDTYNHQPGAADNLFFTASPKDAKFHDGEALPADIAVFNFRKMELAEGQYLRFSVTGSWAPVCALKKSAYAGNINFQNTRVDSSGFTLASGAGETHVRSSSTVHTETNYTDSHASLDGCLGVGLPLGSEFLSANLKACVGVTTGRRVENSKSQVESHANQFSTDARFYSGMRLDNTPFPDYPAGSLLVVIMPKGETALSKKIAVTVLANQAAVFANQDSDLYLVVNDCVDPTALTDQLTINATRVSTKHEAAANTLRSALQGIKVIEEGAEKAINTGSISTRVLQTLKAQVIANLTADGTTPPDFYAFPVLLNLFNYWLDNEVLKVELMAEARSLERQIDILALEQERFQAAEKSNAQIKNIIELQYHFASNAADLYFIVEPLNRAVSYLRTRLIPMIKLHYPKVLKDIPAAQIQSLLPSIDAPLTDVGKDVLTVISSINDHLEDSYSVFANSTQSYTLMVRFPKPGGVPIPIAVPTADETRSRAVWEALTGGSKESSVNIDFQAADFYQPWLPSWRLSCQQVKPVIRDMMIGIGFKDAELEAPELSAWNSKQISVNSEFTGQLTFPQVFGPEKFRLANPNVSSKILGVGFFPGEIIGKLQEIFESKSFAGKAGLGMSPMSTLKLTNLASVRSIFGEKSVCPTCLSLSRISDIYVAFKVDVNTVAEGNQISWMKNCGGLNK